MGNLARAAQDGDSLHEQKAVTSDMYQGERRCISLSSNAKSLSILPLLLNGETARQSDTCETFFAFAFSWSQPKIFTGAGAQDMFGSCSMNLFLFPFFFF
jgi:hypothetical protein